MTTATKKEPNFQTVTNRYARRVIASMRDDLDALEHARECKEYPDSCKRGKETRTVTLQDGRKVKQHRHENPEAWHDEDAARRVIEECPLSIEVREDWHAPGATGEIGEFNILLGTGGPASRVIGDLDRGSPTAARFQYQDWFKPWTDAELSKEDEETLLEWAQVFYFGD